MTDSFGTRYDADAMALLTASVKGDVVAQQLLADWYDDNGSEGDSLRNDIGYGNGAMFARAALSDIARTTAAAN